MLPLLRPPPPKNRDQNPRGRSYPFFSIVNCSGSSIGAAADVVVDVGAGGALGVGTDNARGADPEDSADGVSEGFGELRFFGAGVSSSSGVGFFFALPFAFSFAADVFFFADFDGEALGDFFGFGVASDSSGVSVGFAFTADFFFFGEGLGDSPSFLSGVSEGFAFGLGVGEVFFFALFFFGVGDSRGDGDDAESALRI